MNQKYIFVVSMFLGSIPSLMIGMKNQELSEIAKRSINIYAQKEGTLAIIKQLEKACPDRYFSQNDGHKVILVKRTPALAFKLYFMKNIEEVKKGGSLFNDDKELNEMIFKAIENNEKNDRYLPNEKNIQFSDDLIIEESPNNWIELDTIEYWHKKNDKGQKFVKCEYTFSYEDREKIAEFVKLSGFQKN